MNKKDDDFMRVPQDLIQTATRLSGRINSPSLNKHFVMV